MSFFRNASADEAYYLKESALIAELLSKGKWIGDYGVGLHGFLFKLPVAVLFIIFKEPSVFIATLFTILLSISSLILFYKTVRRYFLEEIYAIWATILLSVAFHFIDTSISFNRDIPAVFTVLLFTYLFLKNANMWLIGISLLLMLDAKEHVFLTVAPLYGVFLLMNQVSNIKKGDIKIAIKDVIAKLFSGYILPIIWIVLMFTTSIIPINVFIPSIFGLTETGLEWNKIHFSTEVVGENLMGEGEREIPKVSTSGSIKKICINKGDSEIDNNNLVEDSDSNVIANIKNNIICSVSYLLDIISAYVGKILYPRTFSFISIPKIIILPAIIHSITLFAYWWKKRDKKYIFPIIILFNIFVVIVRVSHGRYLLGVTPLIFLFFIMFIKDCLKNQKYFRNILISTTIFVLLGLLFESTFVELKIILELSLLILFWAIWYFREKSKKFVNIVKYVFVSSLALGMFLTSLAFFVEIGQISSYRKYGYNQETKIIAQQFDVKEKIWINDYGSGDLINVYRNNYYNEPEWVWDLADWIPKENLLKVYKYNNTFMSEIIDIKNFQKEIETNGITKIVLVTSTLGNEVFPSQERLNELQSQEWLKFEKRVELKNKILYIFKVEN